MYLCRIGFFFQGFTSCLFMSRSGMCLWECVSESLSFMSLCIHAYAGSSGGCDLHESAESCNYQRPVQNPPNLYWHGFKGEAPHSADLSLTPVFALGQRTAETLSFRELSVFSQRGGKEGRLNHFRRGALSPIVLQLSRLLGKFALRVGRTHDRILPGFQRVLSDKIITAFYCFAAGRPT